MCDNPKAVISLTHTVKVGGREWRPYGVLHVDAFAIDVVTQSPSVSGSGETTILTLRSGLEYRVMELHLEVMGLMQQAIKLADGIEEAKHIQPIRLGDEQ